MASIAKPNAHMLPLKRQYRREGFAIAKGYLETEILSHIRESVLLLSREERVDRSDKIIEVGADYSCLNYDLRLAPSEVIDFALSEALTSLVRFMTGWDNAYLYDYYIFKKPEGAPSTPWHRDGDYLPIHGELCTLWIPLDHYDKALQYASGTNLLNPDESKCESQEQLETLFTSPGIKLYDTGSMDVGDIDIHNHKVWHLGPGNTTEKSRQAVAFTYVPRGSKVKLNPTGFDPASGLPQRNSHVQEYFDGNENIELTGYHLIKAF